MAISATHYRLLRLLAKERKIFPPKPAILEIGEANWYGDADPHIILEDVEDEKERKSLAFYIDNVIANLDDTQRGLYDLAKLVYRVLLGSEGMPVSVDQHGTEFAQRRDLNYPVQFLYRYDVVVNHGTLEHIFDIAQAFETIHESCALDGVMIHESPFHGWLDHGFYNLQPTLFYDLADANNYLIEVVFLEHIEGGITQEVYDRDQMHELIQHKQILEGTMLFVALRKQSNLKFRKPMQAIYDKGLSNTGNKAWREAR